MIVVPAPPAPEPLTESLSISMGATTKEAVRVAAKAAGKSMSAWGLEAVRAKLTP